MRLSALAIIIVLMSGCAALKGFALDALSPSKGGINTEIVLGDKEQTLGTNQEVKATNVGKVVGQNDNSLDIARATDVVVTNNTYPAWLVISLLIGNVVFLCMPTPTKTIKNIYNFFRRKPDAI